MNQHLSDLLPMGDADTHNMLVFKTQMCEKYYNKNLQLKSTITQLKKDLANKDKLLCKQRSIWKEIKTMKD